MALGRLNNSYLCNLVTNFFWPFHFEDKASVSSANSTNTMSHLVNDNNEVSRLFDYLLENNKFDKEIRNLLLYKKALYKSNYVDELKLLEEIKPLLYNERSIWKVHALLLLGDFYYSRNEYKKARDFYVQIISMKNLQQDLYDQAKLKLVLISDD